MITEGALSAAPLEHAPPATSRPQLLVAREGTRADHSKDQDQMALQDLMGLRDQMGLQGMMAATLMGHHREATMGLQALALMIRSLQLHHDLRCAIRTAVEHHRAMEVMETTRMAQLLRSIAEVHQECMERLQVQAAQTGWVAALTGQGLQGDMRASIPRDTVAAAASSTKALDMGQEAHLASRVLQAIPTEVLVLKMAFRDKIIRPASHQAWDLQVVQVP